MALPSSTSTNLAAHSARQAADAFGSSTVFRPPWNSRPSFTSTRTYVPKSLCCGTVEDYDGDTYRAVYTAAFPEVVYVLDAFVKKSKSGIKTPQADKDRVRDRFKAAKRDYDEHHRKREK